MLSRRPNQQTHHNIYAFVLDADKSLLVCTGEQQAIVNGSPFSLSRRGYVVEGRDRLVHKSAGPRDAGSHGGCPVGQSKRAFRLDHGEEGADVEATTGQTHKEVGGACHF